MSRTRCKYFFSGRESRIWRPESVSILRSAKTIVLQGCDVINRSEETSVMADKEDSSSGATYCSAGGPNGENCENKTGTPNISMHYFPSNESIRQKWTRFVQRHRRGFVPKKKSALCSAHFADDCFHVKGITVCDESGKKITPKRHLITGSVPTRDMVVPYTSPLTSRKRRRVSKHLEIYCIVISSRITVGLF